MFSIKKWLHNTSIKKTSFNIYKYIEKNVSYFHLLIGSLAKWQNISKDFSKKVLKFNMSSY